MTKTHDQLVAEVLAEAADFHRIMRRPIGAPPVARDARDIEEQVEAEEGAP